MTRETALYDATLFFLAAKAVFGLVVAAVVWTSSGVADRQPPGRRLLDVALVLFFVAFAAVSLRDMVVIYQNPSVVIWWGTAIRALSWLAEGLVIYAVWRERVAGKGRA